MKRRTRKQWYEYHLARSQADACAPVLARYSPLIAAAEERIKIARAQLASAEALEPWTSRIANFFGFRTEFRVQVLSPLETKLKEQEGSLSALRQSQRTELQQAGMRGTDEYRTAHALRKEEAIARANHAVERKHERRLQYLERSPAIRSAARSVKQLLIRSHATDQEYVTCFYCGVSILATQSHLEHKRPLSRGGDNRRTNLVLACPSCNLKKGRKTHEEFLHSPYKDAL